jgi:hypothetical protein
MFGFKNLLALIGLAVVAFVGAGYYLGWYSIGAQADSQGHQELKIQVDASKVEGDISKGEQKVIKVLQNQGVVQPQMPPLPAQQPLPGMPPSVPGGQVSLPSIPSRSEQWPTPVAPPAPPPVDTYNLPR